jgi:hypothetical protein
VALSICVARFAKHCTHDHEDRQTKQCRDQVGTQDEDYELADDRGGLYILGPVPAEEIYHRYSDAAVENERDGRVCDACGSISLKLCHPLKYSGGTRNYKCDSERWETSTISLAESKSISRATYRVRRNTE